MRRRYRDNKLPLDFGELVRLQLFHRRAARFTQLRAGAPSLKCSCHLLRDLVVCSQPRRRLFGTERIQLLCTSKAADPADSLYVPIWRRPDHDGLWPLFEERIYSND